MTAKQQDRCIYISGPYKGYLGRAEFDNESRHFHGEVLGTKDVISFQAKAVEDLRRAFTGSVDDYLTFCKDRGEAPEKPFSGKFVARISPQLHRQVSMLAEVSGKSLNSLVEECLSQIVGKSVSSDRLAASADQPSATKPAKRRATRHRQHT
jgi:predicted HicB family RNase H-like nuclease